MYFFLVQIFYSENGARQVGRKASWPGLPVTTKTPRSWGHPEGLAGMPAAAHPMKMGEQMTHLGAHGCLLYGTRLLGVLES